jgi:hypothetical protein
MRHLLSALGKYGLWTPHSIKTARESKPHDEWLSVASYTNERPFVPVLGGSIKLTARCNGSSGLAFQLITRHCLAPRRSGRALQFPSEDVTFLTRANGNVGKQKRLKQSFWLRS